MISSIFFIRNVTALAHEVLNVVSSWNALMKDQIATILGVKRRKNTGELELLYFSGADLALLMLSTIPRLVIPKRLYLAWKE